MTTVRLTVGQAIVRFLIAQRSERDGVEHRLIAGMFGILRPWQRRGPGAAVLEPELADSHAMPYYQGRNEQGMVHTATGFARQRNRLSTMACLTQIGPGADQHGDRRGDSHRQPAARAAPAKRRVRDTRCRPGPPAARTPDGQRHSVNDCLRPVARYFDRVWRPEQLRLGAPRCAMRVLTDPVETGAAVIALPEDVQAEADDWPEELFENAGVARRTADSPRRPRWLVRWR